MNTPVSFKLAKLLKEKGFDKPTEKWYHRETKKLNTNDLMFSMNKLTDNYSAPTIAEVVMWLYEKHGIWISIDWTPQNNGDEYPFKVFWYYFVSEKIGNPKNTIDNVDETEFNSPTEAYEAAIEYCLNKLI